VKAFSKVMPLCMCVAKLIITCNKAQISNLFQNLMMYSNSAYFYLALWAHNIRAKNIFMAGTYKQHFSVRP
jgi:hypothetical protein